MRLGVPGVLALGLLLVGLPLCTWRRLPAASELRPVAVAAIASEIALLVVAATVATLSWEQLGVLFWMIAGLGIAACEVARR